MSDADLIDKIQTLTNELNDTKKELFLRRLQRVVQTPLDNVTDITFEQVDDDWFFAYHHTTRKYNKDAYNYNTDSDSDNESDSVENKERTTYVELSYEDGNYYLVGTSKNRFRIYRNNSKNVLRIINRDYDDEFDVDEHISKITEYSKNKDIPEWLALALIVFMIDHEWKDSDLTECFLHT